MKRKIIIIQTYLPHYRKSFFEGLCNSKNQETIVVAGTGSSNFKPFETDNKKIITPLRNRFFKIGGHKFIVQLGLLSFLLKSKPTDVVFGGPDIHNISTTISFIFLKIFSSTKIHWWTHGINDRNKVVKKFQNFIILRSHGVLTYEEEGKKYLLESINFEESKVTVIKNSIAEEDYGYNRTNVLQVKNEQKESYNILFSGRLTHQKRCDILIEAISKLSIEGIKIFCHVIGNGEAMDSCKELSHQLGLNGKVIFHGELYDENAERLFKSSDIFVLPGKVGLSAIHALSYGLPVITTNLKVHSPEYAVIKKGLNGDFFEGYDANALADKLATWYHMINENRLKIKERCINQLKKCGYTPKDVITAFEGHFNQTQYFERK